MWSGVLGGLSIATAFVMALLLVALIVLFPVIGLALAVVVALAAVRAWRKHRRRWRQVSRSARPMVAIMAAQGYDATQRQALVNVALHRLNQRRQDERQRWIDQDEQRPHGFLW